MESQTDYTKPAAEKNLFDLQFDLQAASYLKETAKWAKFLAILGFIGCGLIFIGMLVVLFAGALLGGFMDRYSSFGFMGGAFFSILFLAMILIYFFPCLYLFRFATRMQVAIRNNDQEQLTISLRNLKSCYKFIGILALIGLSIYALAIVFGIIGAIFR